MPIDPVRATIEDLTRRVTIISERRDRMAVRVEELALSQKEMLKQLAEKDATVRTLLDIIADYVTERHYRQTGDLHTLVRMVKRQEPPDSIDVEGLPPFVD